MTEIKLLVCIIFIIGIIAITVFTIRGIIKNNRELRQFRKEIDERLKIPTHKKGKWIIDYKEAWRIWHCHCSNCEKDPQEYIGGTEDWWLVHLPKYCPNCGARMEDDSK